MKCAVCGAPSSEREIFEGISIGEILSICEPCAEEEGIPIIKKPSQHQLAKADVHHTVRERMERLSGMRRTTTPLSDEEFSSQSLRARLKEPPKVQTNEVVVPNYHWNLTLARRRKKMTLSQVSHQTGVSQSDLSAIERGRIPADFVDSFIALENFFGITLLAKHPKKVNFIRRDEESQEEILASVREKMLNPDSEEVDTTPDIEPVKRVSSQKDVTLSQLIDRKRKRDLENKRITAKKQEEDMLGEDLDFDLSEL